MLTNSRHRALQVRVRVALVLRLMNANMPDSFGIEVYLDATVIAFYKQSKFMRKAYAR